MTAASATSDIIVTDRGGDNPVRLIAADLACSWEINLAGSLSCRVPADDVRRAGLDTDFRGKWLAFEHPTAGQWGGVITVSPVRDGIVEIVGQSFAILAKKRLVSMGATAPPGSLFYSAFAQVANAAPLFLTLGAVDLGGGAVEGAFAFEDFYETVAPALTIDTGYEWHVSPVGVVTFAKQIGVDRSASVRFEEGVEIANSTWTPDLFPITNRIVAVGVGTSTSPIYTTTPGKKKKGKKKGRHPSKTVITGYDSAQYAIGPYWFVNQESVDRYGPLEEFQDLGSVGDSTGYNTAAIARLAAESGNLAVTGELTLVDVNDAFAKFDEGDTITINLGLSGVSGSLRVMARALDMNAGTLTVAGFGTITTA